MSDKRPEKPCCARMDHGGWCLLVDGHEGDHVGRPTLDDIEPIDFGPKHKRLEPIR